MTEQEARSMFTLAGFVVLKMWALVDGYGSPPDDPRYYEVAPNQVWWLVKTGDGLIRVGWRKRVIHIDWEDIAWRGSVTKDDVTQEHSFVHAWGYPKAVEYLSELRRMIQAV